MKRLSLALGILALATLPASSAFADTFFDFTFTGALFSGSGVFDTQSIGGGEYTILHVSGQVDNVAIGDVLAANTYPVGIGENPNDNILIYPPTLGGTKFFDKYGVSFSLTNGIDVNLNDTLGFENAVAGKTNIFEFDTVTVTPDLAHAPEPSSLALLGTGALAFAGAVRRRLMA